MLLDRPGSPAGSRFSTGGLATTQFEVSCPGCENIDININRTKTHAKTIRLKALLQHTLIATEKRRQSLVQSNVVVPASFSCSFVVSLHRFEHITCVLCPRCSRLASLRTFSTSRRHRIHVAINFNTQYPLRLVQLLAKCDGGKRCRLGASPWVGRRKRHAHAQ